MKRSRSATRAERQAGKEKEEIPKQIALPEDDDSDDSDTEWREEDLSEGDETPSDLDSDDVDDEDDTPSLRGDDATSATSSTWEIDPVYDSDTSDEETVNTIGNVPLRWYEDEDHIGYTITGDKILKPKDMDELEKFLAQVEDPDLWRSVVDGKEGGMNVKLTNEQLEMLERIKNNMFPDAEYDPYQPTVEWFTSKVEQHPLSSAPEPKRRFIPSKWEAQRILRMVRAIRRQRQLPESEKAKLQKKDETESVYDIWGEERDTKLDDIMYIPPPKAPLPGNEESYNPPEEYLLSQEEIEAKKEEDPDAKLFVPKKYESLRTVPAYDRFIQERFDRCLDLYLCPRMIKKKMDVDPESLIPKLPRPDELKPFPSTLSIVYEGHEGKVTSISVDPSGQWLASGSADNTVRIWEVSTGRCRRLYRFQGFVRCVSWNPSKTLCLLGVAADNHVYVLNPKLGRQDIIEETDGLLQQTSSAAKSRLEKQQQEKKACHWSFMASPSFDGATKEGEDGSEESDKKKGVKTGRSEVGVAVSLRFAKPINWITWHRKGDYFASVSAEAGSTAVMIHQLSKHHSQSPFRKSLGIVQSVLFHPNRPFLLVATQRYVRIYNLSTQTLLKTLQPGVKWISSMDIHPKGDNVIIGSYDRRFCWFDLDLSVKPYKTLRYHKSALRSVAFHKRYPLFASCSDDGTLNVFHGMVYNDLMQNPLLVPLKSIPAHAMKGHLGNLS
ncbi:Ribosome biogenesis protein 1 [Quaeritorhiza haematococci]|nr:Ribosome biogenesis protein 1 [Quaeritorhiza haematococci]